MKTLIYSAKDFEIPFLKTANQGKHDFTFISDRLKPETAAMAAGFEAISIFSADDASAAVLEKLKECGVQYITLRSAGHDNVDLKAAAQLGIQVANAPDYSPYAIAEHAIGLLLALNRKILLSLRRAQRGERKHVQDYNFELGQLIGFDLNGKTAGVVGTGKIGSVIVKILNGFGCHILATDPSENQSLKQEFQVQYTSLESVCQKADFIILSLPLNAHTYRIIDSSKLALMKKEVLLVNIARGAVVHTAELMQHIEQNPGFGYATDVYDKESGVFFYDRSNNPPEDPVLKRMLAHERILLTPHQAFATREAIGNIAATTVENLSAWGNGEVLGNLLG